MASQDTAKHVGRQIEQLKAEAKQLECEAEEKRAAAAAKYAEICRLASEACSSNVGKPQLSLLTTRGAKVKQRLRRAKTGVKTFAWQRASKSVRRAA